jgi:hypothetical protein
MLVHSPNADGFSAGPGVWIVSLRKTTLADNIFDFLPNYELKIKNYE